MTDRTDGESPPPPTGTSYTVSNVGSGVRRPGWATGLSVTGAGALFIGLRLFAVSEYDWQRAFPVADTIGLDDAPTVFIGTLMADPQISGLMLMILLPMSVLHQIRAGPSGGGMAWLVIVGIFSVAVFRTYPRWWLIAGALAIGGLLGAVGWLGHRERGQRIAVWLVKRLGLVAMMAALVLAAVVRTPWVAHERIETTKGVVEGYVLETPSGFLKVLGEPDRRMAILVSGDVTAREEIEPDW